MFIFVNCFLNVTCDVTLVSRVYGLSFICRVLVAFLKKLFSSSDTKCFSDKVFSFLLTRVFLFVIFLFSEYKGCIFFQKLLLSETFFGFILPKYACSS